MPEQRPGPEGGRRARNRQLKTEALCHAALELFLKSGIESVTIEQIASNAGVAKGSFYRYFKDKTELVETLLRSLQSAFTEAMNQCRQDLEQVENRIQLFEAYRTLGQTLAEPMITQAGLVQLYLQESRAPGVGARAPVRTLALEIGRQAIELGWVAHDRGLLRPIDPRVAALTVVGAVERLLFGFLAGEDVGPPLAAPEALVSIILDGLNLRGVDSGS
ncbi:MAG: TetR/AcrR family transcriptional regulator [Bradymonadia bacterium]